LRGCGCRSVVCVGVGACVEPLCGCQCELYVGGQAWSNERAGGWHVAWIWDEVRSGWCDVVACRRGGVSGKFQEAGCCDCCAAVTGSVCEERC
jgi:hypothetical protein